MFSCLGFLLISNFLFFSHVHEDSTQQHHTKMFSCKVLNYPVKNYFELKQLFDVVYVPSFEPYDLVGLTSLENGYAQYALKDIDKWMARKRYVTVNSIDIVFTNYPFCINDWITNYYELLSNRLKELFALDRELNSANINWRLVKQTDCENGAEAEAMFHGIVIHYTTNSLYPIKKHGFEVITPDIKAQDRFKQKIYFKVKTPDSLPAEDIQQLLYPESIFNRHVAENSPPTKIRKNDEPGCPSIRTVPRSSWRVRLSRIFKR